MNKLQVYPTSRALRTIGARLKESDSLLPSLMRMDEFEQRSILLENKIRIDPLQRILFLREAAYLTQKKFDTVSELKIDFSLLKFFEKSDGLFKFFEELSVENVCFDTLKKADAYVEFDRHLEVLEGVLYHYNQLLQRRGYIDKVTIPKSYKINKGFIQRYEKIEIYLEGYLSYFELKLMKRIAKYTEVVIYYTTSQFNHKMQERFKDIGIVLPHDSHVVFSLSRNSLLSSMKNDMQIKAKVYHVEQREEQIAVAFEEIERMVHSGIAAESIVLILPEERFKEHFVLFDTQHNLNFAMGYDYSRGYIYKSLEALYRYWSRDDKQSRELLEHYGFKIENIEKSAITQKVQVEDFFLFIDNMGLHDAPIDSTTKKENFNTEVYEKYVHFTHLLAKEKFMLKEWLFLWIKTLDKITLDDVRGGKITVMGVLETRGVHFDGVVIVDFNEGIVPAKLSKDQFLNSQVRTFAKLPTKKDRESLQKQYYKRLLEQAKKAVILYSTSDNKLPSRFLYELGLDKAEQTQAQFDLLYAQASQRKDLKDPVVDFDATSIIWSASRLKSFLECKRKYYYRYIKKLQAKSDDELNEGVFLHSLLDHLHREHNSYRSVEEMQKNINILLDQLLPHEDAKTNYQKLLWKEKLKGFVQSQIAHFNAEWKVVEREIEFQSQIGGLTFKGRIDRIDQNATETLVLDYKSGSTKEAQKIQNVETLTDLQMSIYHQILSAKYQNIKLAFVKLFENGEIEEISALEEKNRRLEEVIIELKQTKQFVAHQTEDLQKCRYCEFTLMCQRGDYL